jgi:hypothetical protein
MVDSYSGDCLSNLLIAEIEAFRRFIFNRVALRSMILRDVYRPCLIAFLLPLGAPGDLPPWIQQTRFPRMAPLPQRMPVVFDLARHFGNALISHGGLLFLSQP